MTNLNTMVQTYGLSENEAKIYLAILETGEASILDIARKSKIKRTSLYYMIDDLTARAVIHKTKRNKKIYYVATSPTDLLKQFRLRATEFEKYAEVLEQHKNQVFKKPRMYFLEGPAGFKQTWNLIFNSNPREYRITTEGINFLDFVKEKYVVSEIIAKDKFENRQTRVMPAHTKLPFTEIICPKLVAYISPRFNNNIFIIEDETFAESKRVMFDLLWEKLPRPE